MAYRLTTPAQRDVTEILHYLLEEASAPVVKRLESEFRAAFRRLAANPGLGHKRQDLTDEHVLFLAVNPYLVVYEPLENGILIHAVVHGARDVSSLLAQGRF